jgi:hypothetical protein
MKDRTYLSGAFMMPALSFLDAYLLLPAYMRTPAAVASEEDARRL